MKKNIWVTFGIVLLGGGLCLAQSEQPSLGELAKQKKTARKAAKTFTEADLPGAKANTKETAIAAPAVQDASRETTGSTVVSAEKKENAKQTGPATKDAPAVAQLKKQIETYQQDRDTWQESAKRYEALLANETNDFRRQTYEDALENDKKNVAFYQEKLGQAQTELANQQKTAPSGSSAGAPAQP
ncbi:MAG: hypothetical protein ACXWBH_13425 [Candidatus Angelobacter sp.]